MEDMIWQHSVFPVVKNLCIPTVVSPISQGSSLSFFKNCGIVQGVAQRAAAGDASIAVADQEVAQLLPTIL
jgi:hypothetical protein